MFRVVNRLAIEAKKEREARRVIGGESNNFTALTRRVFEYWVGLRPEGGLPSRADIDPADLKADLPHLMLLEVLNDPLDFRYRLVGTAVDRFSGVGRTGKRVSAVAGTVSSVWRNLCQVLETGQPSTASIPYEGPEKDYVTTAQVALPLLGPSGRIEFILIAIDYLRHPHALDPL